MRSLIARAWECLEAAAELLEFGEAALDGPALGIMVDQHGGLGLRVVGGEAPGLLHAPGTDADYGAHLLPLCRDRRVAQLAGAAALAHPVSRRSRLAGDIGDADVAAKADDVAGAQLAQEGEQLLVAKPRSARMVTRKSGGMLSARGRRQASS